MARVVFTGGPHSGKTTLFNALQTVYPDAVFVREPATSLIEAQRVRESEGEIGIFPWTERRLFSKLVTEEAVRLEAAASIDAPLIFQDRCVIDALAYAVHEGYTDLIPEIRKRVNPAKYTLAILCEPVGVYAQTHDRKEDAMEALRLHETLVDTYEAQGVSIARLGSVGVPERLQVVNSILTEMAANVDGIL